ncbi:MAG: helix-turn-helix domain-containing protein [Clostridia bacterium]|nr:helix-turn-helix domain-containing protein [Clostridia bacterium]
MEKFIERLKELRLEKGLTLVQLAKETGISHGAIGFWESGKRVPNALAIITLAKYFNVTSDYLLGLSD